MDRDPEASVGRRWRTIVCPLALSAALVSTLGCHAFVKENYFLATPQEDQDARNYYRVTVRGRAIASRARYVSGFFDDSAVEEYFGEFSQPKGGKFGSKENGESDSTEDEVVDDRLQHRSLVLLLSANSDAVAGQIGALAENEQTMSALGGLLGLQQQTELTETNQELVELETQTDNFVAEAQALLSNPDELSQADVMALGNRLATILGATEHFDDPAQLQGWLDARRSALLTEGR